MEGYLRRIIMRSAAPLTFQPQVRSTSPIAQDDQRLGMPGFEEAPSSFRPSMEEGPEPSISSTRPSRLSARATSYFSPEPGRRQPIASSPALFTTTRQVTESRPELKPEFSPKASVDVTLEGSTIVRDEATDFDTAEPEATVPSVDIKLPARPRQFPQAMVPANDREPTGASSCESTGDVGGPPPELVPYRPVLTTDIGTESDHDGAKEPAEDREPRIIIGRINVEVIPAVPEPPKTEPFRPKPVTAASASVIGPLSSSIRASRLLSLRYR
jgi:hypothetical protein